MGFTFPENFDNPYTSQSITEFWRRWHITLGRFMRDYLYIPLGGNRTGRFRSYFNLIIVFFLSGLWHGASWNFVVWGCFHGLFLVLDRIFLLKFYALIGKIPSIIITFFIVMIGWVFFRLDDLSDARDYIYKLFCFDFSPNNFYFLNDFYFLLILAFIFSFAGIFKPVLRIQYDFLFNSYNQKKAVAIGILCFALLFISVTSIIGSGFNPFIYYRF
jgi:alginate O-acetyltransferase complex protein AlgI